MNKRSDQEVTIVTLADEHYAIPLAVLGRSITQTLRPGARARLHVIDGGISTETKERLMGSWELSRMDVKFVSPQLGRLRDLPVWGRIPPLTYARVFLPLLVPENCEKAILLDSDTVVLEDLERLASMDLGEHALCAVQDPAVPFVSSVGGLKRYRELGIPGDQPYFNAGVMLVNVRKWRQTNVPERVMEFTQNHADDLNYCDQDGLNAILWAEWESLDPRWQVQPSLNARSSVPLPHLTASQRRIMADDPWILHFSGRLKPWLYRGSTRSHQVFYGYLDQTSWKGWRPAHSLKAWLYRLYDSPLRDWCYPLETWGHAQARSLSRRKERL